MKGKIVGVICALILAGSVAVTAIFGIPKNKDRFTAPAQKGIITLWQIDSFEGGSGSRKELLLSFSRAFERENKGVLVMVVSHTAESAKHALEAGEMPNLISYGNGVSLPPLSPLNGGITATVKSCALGQGCVVKNSAYSAPWAMGGYFIIANPKLTQAIPKSLDSLLVSQGEFNKPLAALALSGYSAGGLEILSPMNAYVKFTGGKTPYFLGTQRDIIRLKARGMEALATPLDGYTDLIQYISLTEKGENGIYAERFIEYILTAPCQAALKKIDMLSPYGLADTDNEHLRALKGLELKSALSPLTASEILGEIDGVSRLALSGDKEAQIKLKNVVGYS